MDIAKNRIFRLDGGMGSEMQKQGMPAEACPEEWACLNQDALNSIYEAYQSASCDALSTFTFGASSIKLSSYSQALAEKSSALNQSLARLAKQCAKAHTLVGGDIGPLGKMLQPNGSLKPQEAFDVFYQQSKALISGGVDYIIIETMLDVAEARLALLAARKAGNLPVFVSLTFENGYTLMGNDPISALITLQSAGAYAVGSNCGAGPEQMLPVIESMAPYAKVPLLAKPNAGLPQLINEQTCYAMQPEEFAQKTLLLAKAGASILGGCCGTTPQHIAALSALLDQESFSPLPLSDKECLSNARRFFAINQLDPPKNVSLADYLLIDPEDWPEQLMDDEAENQIVLFNGGFENPAQREEFCSFALAQAASNLNLPLGFAFAQNSDLIPALMFYPGRAAVSLSNASSAQEASSMLQSAAYYGAYVLNHGNATTAS